MSPRDLQPVEWALAAIRRELAALRDRLQLQQVDDDGALTETARVLETKRGSRR